MTSLPSESTARLFWAAGLPEAAPGIVRDLAERTALIALGLALAGTPRRRVVARALAGALVVELAVLHYFRPGAGR